MNKELIKQWLKEFNQIEVDNYIEYIEKLQTEKKKNKDTWVWEIANIWSTYKKDDELILIFKKVANEWLVFDWKHITLQSTWVSFDYIALKNKMLITYPESLIDVQIVYNWDEFDFAKQDWKVNYNHKIANPFSRNENDIIWAYAVIKNKRWEFLTTLNLEEINKHRKVAKTDFIWKAWFSEMVLKTIFKKSVKIHFSDIFQEIETIDNENSDVENIPQDLKLSWKIEIDEINTIEDLKSYYEKNKWKWKDFDKYVSMRKKQILELNK